MRAKFQCDSVTTTTWSEEAKLSAVYTGNKEDNEFAEATPSGQISITITNPAAKGFLSPGKKYYLDFTEAE